MKAIKITQELSYNDERMTRMEEQLFRNICLRVNDIELLQDAINDCCFEDDTAHVYSDNGEIEEYGEYFDFYMFYKKFEI